MRSPYRLQWNAHSLEMKYDPNGQFACFNTDCWIVSSDGNVQHRRQQRRLKASGGVADTVNTDTVDTDTIKEIMLIIERIGHFSSSSPVFSTLYTHLTNTLTRDKISQI